MRNRRQADDGQAGVRQTGGRSGEVQCLARALRILRELDGEGEVGVTEIARRVGVHKATTSRLLGTLARHGFVSQNDATERYGLGPVFLELAGRVAARLDLVQTARPILEDLARRTRETVNLAVLEAGRVMNIDQVAGTRAIVAVNWVGRATPFHCTSNGKVLVAFLEEAERERLLAAPLEARSRRTIVSPTRLRAELAQVRERGWARAVEEFEEGLSAVASPVRRADGKVVAAVSVAGPAFRMPAPALARIAEAAVEAAGRISRRLGYFERRQSVGNR